MDEICTCEKLLILEDITGPTLREPLDLALVGLNYCWCENTSVFGLQIVQKQSDFLMAKCCRANNQTKMSALVWVSQNFAEILIQVGAICRETVSLLGICFSIEVCRFAPNTTKRHANQTTSLQKHWNIPLTPIWIWPKNLKSRLSPDQTATALSQICSSIPKICLVCFPSRAVWINSTSTHNPTVRCANTQHPLQSEAVKKWSGNDTFIIIIHLNQASRFLHL